MAEIEEEKVFEHFLQVPENVRMRMFDRMEVRDRVRITRCSKLCNKEAKSSKNHFYQLNFCNHAEFFLSIQVLYGNESRTHGYLLCFSGLNSRRQQVRYFTLTNQQRPVWKIKLNNSTDFVQYAIEKFKRMLQARKNEINKLCVFFFVTPTNFEMWRNLDFEVDSLNNLQSLSVHYPIDVQQFLSKIHHPLIELNVSEENTPRLENFEQIYQVRYLSWKSVHLDYQQLLRLSANSIKINIGKLTERNIFNFIRSRQNGSIGRDITLYRWQLEGSNFDRKKLLRLLRVADQEAEYTEIKHFEKPRKCAILRQIPFAVTFGTSMFE